MADYVLVNEPGYPLTPLEQLLRLRDSLPSRPGLQLQSGLADLSNPLELVKVTRPTIDTVADTNSIVQIRKLAGKLGAAVSEELEYVTSLEFPADGMPRANHLHEEHAEFLYVTQGKTRLFYRRGGQRYDRPEQVVLEAGCLVRILPGVAHAFVSIETARAIEFGRSSRQMLHGDVVSDKVID